MNGAESLVRTLVAGGVDVCFANPGTSEMHFVAALDRVDGMRCVLGLHETVVTGAADGYARMAEKPASTLLHLGPGLANGLSNMHNAGRAGSPMVNIVGDHTTFHRNYDAPLTSDIEGAARPFSHWVRTSPDARMVAADGAAAIAAARTPPGRIATLILPADTAWNEADGIAPVPAIPARKMVDHAIVKGIARLLRRNEPTLLLLGGSAVRQTGLEWAGRIAAATGIKIMGQTSNPRMERGAGRVAVERVPFPVDLALDVLKGFQHVVLAGAKAPIGFFAYPGKPSILTPPDCTIHTLARVDEDIIHALEVLADELGARAQKFETARAERPARPTGPITLDSLARAIGALLPEGAIVIDEAITTGRGFFPFTRGAPPHDWLQNMGGSIGLGQPLATGAAVACPSRKVVALQADGSAMYSLQALWTQAREGLDVTTLLFDNRTYAILRHELTNVGASNPGRKALDMLDIGRPDLDWVSLARGMGVPGEKVTTIDEFLDGFARGLAAPGPYLVSVTL
ncbi:MAG: acetolactate synthase large subunit [Alphaproteobacteria bacterium]|nr:acetolactate synthase large subunit [Alphaproteobacteria bacterium]